MEKYKKQSGFSILEIIIAITIIVFGMVGLISLSTQSLTVVNNNREELVAGELAREGIELIKNKRDSNWLVNNSWMQGLAEGDYIIAYNNTVPDPVTGINDAGTTLYINPSGFYSHQAGGATTIFKRMVTISNTSLASTTVSSLVQYQVRGRTEQYKLATVFYDWK